MSLLKEINFDLDDCTKIVERVQVKVGIY